MLNRKRKKKKQTKIKINVLTSLANYLQNNLVSRTSPETAPKFVYAEMCIDTKQSIVAQ